MLQFKNIVYFIMDPSEHLQAFVHAMIDDLNLIGIEVILNDLSVSDQVTVILPIWLENKREVEMAKIIKPRGA